MKRIWLLLASLLLLTTACHGVIKNGPGLPPDGTGPLTDGLWAQPYSVDWQPVGTGSVVGSPTWQFELSSAPGQECNYIACWALIAMTWQGYVRVPVEGDYTVSNYADDGGKIWIDGRVVVDNWGMGGFFGGNSATATVHLTAGDHPYYEEYYNANGLEADTSTSIPGTTWMNRGAGLRGAPAPVSTPPSMTLSKVNATGDQYYDKHDASRRHRKLLALNQSGLESDRCRGRAGRWGRRPERSRPESVLLDCPIRRANARTQHSGN